ncbi:MAG TPA: hypothetical protein VGK29_22945 [Paludibaculum sp.]|jgi:hypothetical protein
MKLYSYIVSHDTGFAPNPFFGYCTLACCKPGIRRTANVGDWIVGLTSKGEGNKIVYFMRVDEVLGVDDYWNDKRFRQKRPRYDKELRLRCGDNIYDPLPNGDFRQLRSMHSDGERERPEKKAKDLGGKNVLISETFAYFGSKPLPLPQELESLIVARGHRSHFTDDVKEEVRRLVSQSALGVHAAPHDWPQDEFSWKGADCSRR